MSKELKFIADGSEHTLQLRSSCVILDGEKILLKSLSVKKDGGLVTYTLPVGKDSIQICNRRFVGVSAVQNGIDLATGKEYSSVPTPKWIYAFVVLYFLDFIFVLGGALGVLFNLGGIALTAKLSLSQNKRTLTKVLLSILLWIVFTILEILIIGLFTYYL